MLSHPDVITLGRASSRQYLRHSEEELNARGIKVVEAGRGGEVTFHGPGQLIAYPILQLRDRERDLHGYLRSLEEIGIGICRSFGIRAQRVKERTGVWVQGKKISAIGVRARSWITFHGVAFNRTRDIEGFHLIVPCGIADAGVTSLEHILDKAVSAQDLQKRFCLQFAEVFKRELLKITPAELHQQISEISHRSKPTTRPPEPRTE